MLSRFFGKIFKLPLKHEKTVEDGYDKISYFPPTHEYQVDRIMHPAPIPALTL